MIEYEYMDDMLSEGTAKKLLITDGTVTVSGTRYTVTNATVTLTNDLIHADSFRLSQSLCSQSQLEYGSCEAAELKFTISDNIPTIKNKILKVYIYLNNDASTMLQLGVFKVDQDSLTGDRTKREITAYDAMYDIINSDVASWYNTLLPSASSSTTIAAMRASLLSHFNLTAETATLVNDSMTVKKTISTDVLSGADVIKAICEINGCFGTITNEGKFRFLELSPGIDDGLFPSDTLYPSDDLYPQDVNPLTTGIAKPHYSSVRFEDYISEEITQLTVRSDGTDVGVTVGTAGNKYTITGNFLVYGKNATELNAIATNILSKMVDRYYKPCDVDCVGNPCHEVGDPVRVNTTYRGVCTYILERELRGIPGLRDNYKAKGEDKYSEEVNSIQNQFKQLEGKTLKLKADVDGVESEVSDLASSTSSRFSQMSSEISAKVDSSGGSPSSFGWSLTSGGFSLVSNNQAMFTCTPSGTTFKNAGSSGTVEISGGAIDSHSNGRSVGISGGTVECSSGAGALATLNGSGVEVVTNGHTSSLSSTSLMIDGRTLSFIPMEDSYGNTVYVLGYSI